MDHIVQRVECTEICINDEWVQCVIAFGVTLMLELYADKLVIIPVVSSEYFTFAVVFSLYTVCYIANIN